MTKHGFLLPFLVAIASGAGSARGDIVVLTGSSSSGSVSFLQHRFGQSFTATAAEPAVGTVSFRWASVNLALPDPTVTIRLREGIGYTGAVLATQSRTLPDSTPDNTWVDFIFPAQPALIPGQMYSLDFALEPSIHSSGGYRDLGDAYGGGTKLNASGVPAPFNDLCFRVLTVPGPASLGVLGLGVVGLRRRR